MFTQLGPIPARRLRRLALPVLVIAGAVTIILASGSPGKSDKSTAQGLVLTVETTQRGADFAPGAIGLSLEADELATRDLSDSHRSLVMLMRSLGPGVLRLAGGSVDLSWWTERKERAPSWATSVVTPSDLDTLHGLLEASGWHVILGIDLGHFDPERAASEAQAAARILGPQLLGFEIGNEPDKFSDPVVKLRSSSYSIASYLNEVARYDTALQAVVPDLRLFGPDLSSQSSWLAPIASDKSAPFDVVTMHYYPTSYSVSKGACKGTAAPTAQELLSPEVRERETAVVSAFVSAAEASDREARITETNTTSSCDVSGAPATSPVFASALWSLDWVLRAASAGVSGLNFHGYFGRCRPEAYNPICAPTYQAEAEGRVAARPEYYGLLAARKLEGGYFMPVQVAGESNLAAYATKHPHGQITVAIDNFAAARTPLILRVPGYSYAKKEVLLAPSLTARSGVTIGKASVDSNGTVRPVMSKIAPRAHDFALTMAAHSAVIITLSR